MVEVTGRPSEMKNAYKVHAQEYLHTFRRETS
jgi:hypothetical protein